MFAMNIDWKYSSEIDAAAVRRVEAEYHVTLPVSLRQAIMEGNNGCPSLYRFDSEAEDEHVFKTLLSYDERDVENVFLAVETLRKSHDEDLFPFADDPAGNLICLENGAVVLWCHENGKRDRVASSVDDFLNSLY